MQQKTSVSWKRQVTPTIGPFTKKGEVMNMMKNNHNPIIQPNRIHCSMASLCSLALALGMLIAAAPAHATSLFWNTGNGVFSTAGSWNPAQVPAAGDETFFTNDASYTVSFSADTPVMLKSTFSNHTGVVTLNIAGHTWLETNNFAIGINDSTSTVYIAGGTLDVESATTGQNGSVRVGDAVTNLYADSFPVGTLFVTNGTLMADRVVMGASSNASGSLIVSGPGAVLDTLNTTTLSTGGGQGSRLIVSNNATFVITATTIGSNTGDSNNLALFVGPNTGSFSPGFIRTGGVGTQLIISNGAKVYTGTSGSLLFGGTAIANTGIVVGAGSSLIVPALASSFQIGTGGAGGTNNFFIVYDGGMVSCGGTFAYGNNQFHVNDGVQLGGTGLMSTGLFKVVRSASNSTNHFGNFLTVTNAYVSSVYLNPQGPGETISILGKATWKMTNSLSSPPAVTNCVNIGGNSSASLFIINGGTLENLQTADNGGGIGLGGGTFSTAGNSLIITNGGKLLSSMGTLGNAWNNNTGIVTGVGSVWSNFNGVGADPNFTNILVVGTGAGGSNNFLGVFDGGLLYNRGTLNIGANSTATVNTVRFGGPGLTPATIRNVGSFNIGSTSNSFGNLVVITNASVNLDTVNVGNSGAYSNTLQINGGTLTVGFMRVRPTNTIVFTAGDLSIGGMTLDTLANSSNGFVVGDGTSAAFYDMAAGGTGYYDFGNVGLVITNGASLRGSGTIVGNVNVLGTFAPGFSVGSIFTSNNLVFGNSATLNYDLGTLSSDSVTVNGNLTLGGTVNVTSSGSFGPGPFVLFTHTNVVSGTLNVGTLPGGFTAVVSNDLPNTPRILLIVSAAITDPYANWASFYGLTGAAALGTANPQGDGMNNTNKFLAGFAPNVVGAYLHITSVTKTSGTNVTITYVGANGNSNASGPTSRTNVLEFTTGTGNGSYSNINFASTGQTNILSGGTGLGTVTSFVDTNATSGATRYYRVRVLVP
jgi:hypothetical protein